MIIGELEQKVIREAGREAAHVCLTLHSDIQSNLMYKADRDPVSIADLCSQAVILHRIAKYFSEDSIITEETVADFRALINTEQKHWLAYYASQALNCPVTINEIKHWLSHQPKQDNRRTWIIDPVDGTRGFFKGDQFAIAIALVIAGQPVLSALVCPLMPFNREVIGAMAIAQKNQGAVLESLDGTLSRTLSVSKQSDLQRVHIALGDVRHLDRKAVERLFSNNQINGTIMQISSQAKYVAVADGQIDLFLRYATDTDNREKVWDHVAGELIVREAGGCVTDLDGKELNFSKGELLTENRGLLVTNRQIHNNLLQIIHNYI